MLPKLWYQVRLPVTAAFLLILALLAGCGQSRDFDSHLDEVIGPYRFDFIKWEVNALAGEAGPFFFGRAENAGNTPLAIEEYFTDVDRIRQLKYWITAIRSGYLAGDLPPLEEELDNLRARNADLADTVEWQFETQLRESLSQQGIYGPLDRCLPLQVRFPPVNFHLGKPPHLLVVSPRDRIESIRQEALLQEMSVEDMEYIESEIDSFDMSSVVLEIGGMATYPSFVTDEADMKFIASAAAEEWLHQYLAFTPLGFLYILDLAGIRPDYDIATMNETVVGIVSDEIGDLVLRQYYGLDVAEETPPEIGFDFNGEMREIRRAVDGMLAAGEIEKAESFMAEKRQYLAENGYFIRKLNQAYFAFHGTYGDSPTSISPIGVELNELRDRSPSLKAFLEKTAGMTSRQELLDSLE